MTGGSFSVSQDGLLVRKREIEELGNRVHHLNGHLSRLEGSRNILLKTKYETEAGLSEMHQLKSALQEDLFRASSALQSAVQKLQSTEQLLDRMNLEIGQLNETRSAFQDDLLQIKSMLQAKNKLLIDGRAEIEKEVDSLQQFQKEMDLMTNQLNGCLIELAEHKEKARAFEAEKKSVETRIEMLREKEMNLKLDLKSIEEKQRDAAGCISELQLIEIALIHQLQSEAEEKNGVKKMREILSERIRSVKKRSAGADIQIRAVKRPGTSVGA
jgi:chromosome segregation ATPase